MPSTPLTLLIDTNVWLDVFLPSRPEAEAARTLLEEAEKRAAEAVRCILTDGFAAAQNRFNG